MSHHEDLPLSGDQLRARLRAEGAARYHDKHPFHVRMHAGDLNQRELQSWVLNRYYYQTRIPIKDALILSKSEDPAFRRGWIRRIQEHDGDGQDPGGLELWLMLAEGVGLERAHVQSLRGVLPGVRFACDAYVTLIRERSLVEAVAASLTELFAPGIMERRLAAWHVHYPWVSQSVQEYFRSRVPRAARDGDAALDFVVRHADSRALQERCVQAFVTKCDILWALLDTVAHEPAVACSRADSRASTAAGAAATREESPGAPGRDEVLLARGPGRFDPTSADG